MTNAMTSSWGARCRDIDGDTGASPSQSARPRCARRGAALEKEAPTVSGRHRRRHSDCRTPPVASTMLAWTPARVRRTAVVVEPQQSPPAVTSVGPPVQPPCRRDSAAVVVAEPRWHRGANLPPTFYLVGLGGCPPRAGERQAAAAMRAQTRRSPLDEDGGRTRSGAHGDSTCCWSTNWTGFSSYSLEGSTARRAQQTESLVSLTALREKDSQPIRSDVVAVVLRRRRLISVLLGGLASGSGPQRLGLGSATPPHTPCSLQANARE